MNDRQRGERLFRAWREVTVPFDEDGGRARFLASAERSRSSPRTARGSVLLLAAAVVACAAVLLLWRGSPTPLRFVTSAGDGRVGAWLATDATTEMPLSFSEGTRVTILADSRGRVERLTADGASFLLERGEVRGEVVHRARTDWRILAGPFEVEVTGTVVDVAWDPARESFAVRVDEGRVVVRGPRLATQQVVRAGERCVVDLTAGTMRLSSTTDDAGAALVPEPDAATTAPPETPTASGAPIAPPIVRAPVAPWTTFEQRGDYDGAYAAAAGVGFASLYRASSADELLRLAHVGQLSGHRVVERESLLACRRRFPGTEQSAVAAYELGRASSPAEAATWFEAYLREQPSGLLAREALGRLVEARAAAGDAAAARDAAKRYLARYPTGPQAALARQVLGGARE